MRKQLYTILTTAVCLVAWGCSSPSPRKEPSEVSKQEAPAAAPAPAPAPPPEPASLPPAPKNAKAPEVFKVNFETSKGSVVVELHRDWAPIGVAHLYNLVRAGYFTDARFFRVVPNFVVQFGLAANPAMTARYLNDNLKDDPVTHHNARGTVVYATAGPNTRTTQLFINLADNTQSLDGQGFAPLGTVVTGLDVVDRLNAEYHETPDQGAITSRGNAYLAQFPRLDFIKTATVE
jgi:peptidyl-prolyl cis-trans isomerase A (cyclophilin A)